MKKVIVSAAAIAIIAVCYAFSTHNSPDVAITITTPQQLGEQLFFDKILSADRSISCASCHIPAFGFADTVAFSKGVGGRIGKRNTQSCANVSDRPYFFYDGRAATLEEQVRFPIEDSNEMSLPIAQAVARLQQSQQYIKWFAQVYKSKPTEKHLKAAIAAYERTLETANTPFDRYMDDNEGAISASAIRGRELFMSSKAKCFDCHFSPDFTGDEFRNIGLYDGVLLKDEGRYAITGNKDDLGKFRVPGLRNVAVTAPYMHNGMFATLRQVIDYYDNPYLTVARPINIDTLLAKPLNLTEQEKQDLENFMLTLTDDRFSKQ